MRIMRVFGVVAMLATSLPAGAQMGMGPRLSGMSGIWHPVVGSGSAYESTNQEGKKTQMEITVVGKEEINGKSAFWMEMSVADPRSGGAMYVKYLVATSDTGTSFTRMVMQPPGQEPVEMEMNVNSDARRQPQTAPSDIRNTAEHVGTETITVPAGTFSCEHYRVKDGSGDVWISDKIAPWGLVKSQGKGNMMVLTKVISDAKDHITGTPKKFDPMQMMRDRSGQRGQ